MEPAVRRLEGGPLRTAWKAESGGPSGLEGPSLSARAGLPSGSPDWALGSLSRDGLQFSVEQTLGQAAVRIS